MESETLDLVNYKDDKIFIDIDQEAETSPHAKPKSRKKKKKIAKKKKQVIDDDIIEEQIKTVFLPMKNVEILIIGGPQTGKSSLMKLFFEDQLVQDKVTESIGMHVYKQEYLVQTGETVRLCVWDPAVSLIEKEKATIELNKEDSGLPFIEEFQIDTNKQLAKDYIKWGVYNAVIFVFDLSDESTFEQMEQWVDLFQSTSKTGETAHFAIVGTKFDVIKKCPMKRALEPEIINDWLSELEEDIRKRGTFQQIKYFEVSSVDNFNVRRLVNWVATQGLGAHKGAEKSRYIKDHVEEKERDCRCHIF